MYFRSHICGKIALAATALLLSVPDVSAKNFDIDSMSTKGYRGMIELGYTVTTDNFYPEDDKGFDRASVAVTNGYRFNKYAFLGFTTGYTRYNDYPTVVEIPILADFTLFVPFKQLKRFTPFVDVRLGWRLLLASYNEKDIFGEIAPDIRGENDWKRRDLLGASTFGTVAAGMRYALGRKTAVNCAVGYTLKQYKGVYFRLGFEF